VKAVYDEGISPGAGPVEAYIEGGTGREMVLLEIGTGTWCVFCPGAAMGADELVENDHNVAVIEYHSGDNYETPESGYRVSNYYGITGFPTAEFDGVITHVGGNANTSLYQTYLPYFEQRETKVSLFELDVEVEMAGDTDIAANVFVDNIYPYPGDNVVLQVVLTESHIPENWFMLSEINFVCRDMVPDQFGTEMDFSGSTSYENTFEMSIAGYEKDNCEVVVFLQDNDTKEVLQAVKFDLEDIVGIGENPLVKSLDMYPNPARDMLHIELDQGLLGVRIMNQTGQLILDRTAEGTGFTLNVSAFETGVYFVEVTTTKGTLTRKLVIN
jgi:thiol-disulfide isomerase/thioredoxin